MANLSSALFTAQSGGAGASLNVTTPLTKNALGKHRIVQVPYTLVGTEATNDLLRLTVLKAGARVIAALSKVTNQIGGTALTVSFGDTSNASRYSGTLTLTSAADQFFPVAVGTDTYVPTDITNVAGAADQTVVIMKFILSTTPTAGNKILVLLAVVDE